MRLTYALDQIRIDGGDWIADVGLFQRIRGGALLVPVTASEGKQAVRFHVPAHFEGEALVVPSFVPSEALQKSWLRVAFPCYHPLRLITKGECFRVQTRKP